MRERISACVICYNEERKIRRCLESLRWCDEIVVLDSFSTDHTVEICREYTPRVIQQEWLGYVGQRNTVRELARNKWVLFMDADEEVSPALREEILSEFERGPGQYVGFEFPRQVYYLGRWIRHGDWYPDVKLRLFKKEYGRTEGEEPHDRVVVHGPVKRLNHPIYHYTYDDIADQLATLNRFSTITAQQRFVQGYRVHRTDLILRPALRFLKSYLLRGGFLDGMHGFLIAVISGFSTFAKYSKVYELSIRQQDDYREFPTEDPNRRGFR